MQELSMILKAFVWFQEQDKCELRFDVKFQGFSKFAEYSSFWVNGEGDNYRLRVSGYHGNAGDSLFFQHNNMQFTTPGHDNDRHSGNCASMYNANGWWYNHCFSANPNAAWGDMNRYAWASAALGGRTIGLVEMKLRVGGNFNRLVIKISLIGPLYIQ